MMLPLSSQIFIREGNSKLPNYRLNHSIQILRSSGCRELDLIKKEHQILAMFVQGHE